MIEDVCNVNEEYEKIFGESKRVNLFDTEEEYLELRQFIISAPNLPYLIDGLPFEGIRVVVNKEKRIQNLKQTNKIVAKDELAHLLSSLLNFSNFKNSGKHLFYIKEVGICNASGYYDEEKRYFYICKDSLVSYETDLFYMASDKDRLRLNFLNKICREENGYFRVIRDAKCRSASAAASYVLGRQSDFISWKDGQGKTLSDIYPGIYNLSIPKNEGLPKVKQEPKVDKKAPKVGRPPRYYYISRDLGNRSCNAKGMYDKTNNSFIIMEGSVLVNEVTSSYRYSASDIKRKKFIQLNCEGEYHNRLKRDVVCNSPDEAACFVLGDTVNGWEEWKSKGGVSLQSYISKM